ncbi:MAG TPA: hypothetical protein VMH39_16485 [Gemmatimonadaceae bacterium]|nr:hypothetical protein [Gemmatimonadaceae bacterium]
MVALGLGQALLISPSGDTVKASARFVGDSATLSFDVAFVATEADYLLVLTAYDVKGQEDAAVYRDGWPSGAIHLVGAQRGWREPQLRHHRLNRLL